MSKIDMDSKITVKQAYKAMFAYLDQYWLEHGKPDEIGDVLSPMALWETASGGMEPMDASIFPEWIKNVNLVLDTESTGNRSELADIRLDGEKPHTKVQR